MSLWFWAAHNEFSVLASTSSNRPMACSQTLTSLLPCGQHPLKQSSHLPVSISVAKTRSIGTELERKSPKLDCYTRLKLGLGILVLHHEPSSAIWFPDSPPN